MTVTVEYFAQAREAAGVARETIAVSEGGTVEHLLQDLALTRPKLARLILSPDGAIASSLAVAVNNRQVQMTQPLREADEVVLMPAVSGG